MQWFNFMVIYMKQWQKEQLSGFVGVQTNLKSCREENIGGVCKRLFKLIVVLMLLFGEGFCSPSATFSSRSGASGCLVIWLIWYCPHEQLLATGWLKQRVHPLLSQIHPPVSSSSSSTSAPCSRPAYVLIKVLPMKYQVLSTRNWLFAVW